MGSVNTKETNTSTSSSTVVLPPSLEKAKRRHMEYVSPLHRSSAFDDSDPRSPGGLRRSPVHSPFSTPTPSSQTYRESIILRLGSASKFNCIDPRSPSSQRTPLADMSVSFGRATPPPFSLGDSRSFVSVDPRSPFMMRTPLALSSQEAVIVDDVIVAEEVVRSSAETPVKVETIEAVVESTGGAESTGNMIRESLSSSSDTYSISPALMALSISHLNSPVLGYRKRKQGTFNSSLSPLKKSFSAPINDENAQPSTSPKLSSTPPNKIRAPLSPLSQRVINTRYCMDIQPIKFRMDPGVLGQ